MEDRRWSKGRQRREDRGGRKRDGGKEGGKEGGKDGGKEDVGTEERRKGIMLVLVLAHAHVRSF